MGEMSGWRPASASAWGPSEPPGPISEGSLSPEAGDQGLLLGQQAFPRQSSLAKSICPTLRQNIPESQYRGSVTRNVELKQKKIGNTIILNQMSTSGCTHGDTPLASCTKCTSVTEFQERKIKHTHNILGRFSILYWTHSRVSWGTCGCVWPLSCRSHTSILYVMGGCALL